MMAKARFNEVQSKYCGVTDDNGKWTGRINIDREALEQPLYWKKPRTIFVCSMSDLFHEDVPDGVIRNIYSTMVQCLQHTFIIVTKRPERIVPVLYDSGHYNKGEHLINVWHLTTTENQAMADKRIPELLKLRQMAEGWPVLGVSIEPMLEEINLVEYISRLDWCIMGAESGHNARPMKLKWAQDILKQCQDAYIPLFYKQGPDFLGQWCKMPVLHGRIWDQMPEVKP